MGRLQVQTQSMIGAWRCITFHGLSLCYLAILPFRFPILAVEMEHHTRSTCTTRRPLGFGPWANNSTIPSVLFDVTRSRSFDSNAPRSVPSRKTDR